MDWTAWTPAVSLPAILVGVAWLAVLGTLIALCRAAALGERPRIEPSPETDADAPPAPAPRTPYELVACALVTLDVEHATLYAGDRPDRLRVLARGHLDVRADSEPAETLADAAGEAMVTQNRVEIGGVPPAPVVAATPVMRKGRVLGALVVSVRRTARGRLTFAERRSLSQLAEHAAALAELQRSRVRR
jgi:hypothetical protein